MKSEQDLIIGLVQASPGMENAEYFIKEATEQGCQILCFPEAFLTGYDTKNVINLSLSVEDEKIQNLTNKLISNINYNDVIIASDTHFGKDRADYFHKIQDVATKINNLTFFPPLGNLFYLTFNNALNSL